MVGVCVCDVCVHTARALPAHSLRCMGTCTHMHAPLSSLRCICCLYRRCTNLSIYREREIYVCIHQSVSIRPGFVPPSPNRHDRLQLPASLPPLSGAALKVMHVHTCA